MKNFAQQFELLGRKQLAIQEGILLLQEAQTELARARAAADAWGVTAILANATLIPLNIIVNAFELKSVNSLYQALIRELYGQFAKSGTRLDGHSKMALALLKKGVIEELKRKARTDLIPGVNILVGLAEDSLAAWQAIQLTNAGRQEGAALTVAVEQKIAAAQRHLVQIGIRRAELLGVLQTYSRTA